MDANLKARLTTALIGIPLLIAFIGWGASWVVAVFVFCVSLVALCEYFAMLFPDRLKEQILGVIFGGTLSLLLIVPDIPDFESKVGVLLVLCFSVYLFLDGQLQQRAIRLGWTLLGGFYLGYLLSSWFVLFRQPEGRAWVFFVLSVIMAGDTVAYFAGKRFGKRKLAPEISPGKTVEGAVGYLVGSIAAGCAGALLWVPQLSVAEAIVLSAVLGVLGQIGDLFESWLKRCCAVKDSSTLLPGHGGLLDRLDSLIFPAVFTTAYLRVFHS